MFDPADKRFFIALKAICADTDGISDECRDVITLAVETGDALNMRAARQAFDALDPGVKDRVLAQLHQKMATDLSAIWDAMPSAPKTDRPN